MATSEETMSRFIAAELERTHGDIGLGSTCKHKPDRSKLGRALVEGKTTDSSQELLEFIVKSAGGNIALAKLRLETIDAFQSVDSTLRIGDRLPDNIQAMFDAGIDRINKKPQAEAALGLKAILGVATRYSGEPFWELQRWLQRQAAFASPANTTSSLEIEEVLHAAAGFLSCDTWDERSVVTLYNEAFTSYVAQNYNESFIWVRSEMQLGIRPRSNSMTMGSGQVSDVSEHPRPKLGPRAEPLTRTLDSLLDRRTEMANSQPAPKRQISEPGTLKEVKKDFAAFSLSRRSTNWL